jgi:hypothetical protein
MARRVLDLGMGPVAGRFRDVFTQRVVARVTSPVVS